VTATVGTRRLVREVRSGSSYLGQSDVRVHFGLGQAKVVDRLDVRWPSGRVDVLKAIASQQDVTVAEGEGVVDSQPLNRR
jgi:hypothetical protein